MKLEKHEAALVGEWHMDRGRMVENATCERIKALIGHHLQRIADAEGGWSVLFQDPNDGRYWELTYPPSEMHGGGPPRLTCIDQQTAESRYGLDYP